ncbi:ARF-binding protein [Desmophyllum pertusum]|uniref:ARF-binding protein n=1 Tax=Desmophyllum pertusum TaxID=174260 RepID=A0A9X0CG78_9CNID|nr:ARF-binding protein [Desmophyllum pertusum]
MKELYDACDRMRPQLFRLASSATEEGDEGLADILRVNDDLSRGLEYYRRIFGLAPLTTSAKTGPASPPVTQTAAPEGGSVGGASTLIDLGSAGQHGESTETPASSVLENELKALGLHDIAPPATSNSQIPLQQVAQQPGVVGPWAAPTQNFGMLPPNASSMVGVVRPLGQHQAAGMMPPIYMGVGQMPRMPFQAMGLGAMSMAPRPGPMSMGTSSLAMQTTGSAARGNLPAAGEGELQRRRGHLMHLTCWVKKCCRARSSNRSRNKLLLHYKRKLHQNNSKDQRRQLIACCH